MRACELPGPCLTPSRKPVAGSSPCNTAPRASAALPRALVYEHPTSSGSLGCHRRNWYRHPFHQRLDSRHRLPHRLRSGKNCSAAGPDQARYEILKHLRPVGRPHANVMVVRADAKGFGQRARNASVEQDVLYFVFPNSAFAEGALNLETINTKVKERAF